MQADYDRLLAEQERIRNSLTEAQDALRSATAAVEKMIGTEFDSSEKLESILAMERERVERTRSLLAKIAVFIKRFPWPDQASTTDLLILIKSLRSLAGDYQATVTKERNAAASHTASLHRKEQMEKQIAGLVPQIDRLTEAQGVLTRIRTEHSLTSGMDTTLRKNRTAIESIFGRIHSPAEFAGLGSNLTTLVRKKDGSPATLHQISTGQRAAFALSLFLAQNSQLRTAPPMILIDDPIAHIDDLNCLSFLDYLREVVVAGDRQFVFSTANDKLATLFERKFEFLGEEGFRRYDLVR